MTGAKRLIPNALLLSVFGALIALTLSYSPVQSELQEEPCHITCRSYVKCPPSKGDGEGCDPIIPRRLCNGTWGPEEECVTHWCEDGCS